MEVVRQTAFDRLSQHLDELHRLGRDITLSGLYAALHQPGVQRVELTEPATTLVLAPHQAGFKQSITISVGGRDE
jgi:phage-related baseplate assembly protein